MIFCFAFSNLKNRANVNDLRKKSLIELERSEITVVSKMMEVVELEALPEGEIGEC